MKSRIRRITGLGLLFAISMVLSLFENMIVAGISLPFGIKLGLSNIIVMAVVYILGAREAYFLAFLKSLFVLFTKTMTSAMMSISGGLASVTIMVFAYENN